MRLVVPPPPMHLEQECSPIQPLPFDVEVWHREVLRGAEQLERTREQTVDGWPFTLVRCRTKMVAFYELVDRCCVVTVSGSSDAFDLVRENLAAAAIDWQSDDLRAITQLWELD